MARQVLITGVTGGIGGALAESFTANGDMVIGIGRRRDKLTALRDRLGESLDSLQADLETVEGIDAAVEDVPSGVAVREDSGQAFNDIAIVLVKVSPMLNTQRFQTKQHGCATFRRCARYPTPHQEAVTTR